MRLPHPLLRLARRFLPLLAIGLAQAAPLENPNLLDNPGFETGDLSGWTVYGAAASLSLQSTGCFAGTHCVLAGNRTQSYGGIAQSILGKLSPGVNYLFAARVRLVTPAAADQNFQIGIKQVDGAGTRYLTADYMRVPAGETGWIKMAAWWSYQPSGAPTTLQLYVNGPAAGLSFLVDDISVTAPLAYTPPASTPASAFVRASGRDLVVGADNRVTRLLGTNFNAYSDDDTETVEGLLRAHYFDPDSDYLAVAGLGMNTVRLNLWWKFFEDPANPYSYLDSGWQWLERNIIRAREAGVRLILDMHAPQCGFQSPDYTGNFWGSDPGCRDRLKALWVAIAARYKTEPVIASYDLLNEPNPPTNQQWIDYLNELVPAIRTVDPNHLIQVEQTFAPDSANFLLSDRNVIYDFHDYNPWSWTAQLSYFSGYGDTGARYPDPAATVIPWRWDYGALAENAPIPTGSTGWSWYEGTPIAVPGDAAIFGAVPAFVSGINGGSILFDDFVIDEYDANGALLRRLTSVDIESRPTEWYFLRDYDPFQSFTEYWSLVKLSGAATKTVVADAHLGSKAFSLGAVTGKALLRTPNLKFLVKPGHKYKISGWMKGNGVTGQSGGLGLQWLRFKSGDGPSPFTADTLEQLMLDEAVAYYQANNRPVNIGEFGLSFNNFENDRGGGRWLADILERMERYGLSGQYWAWRDAVFGITHEPQGYPDPAKANPALTAILGAAWQPVSPTDRDGDGFPDAADSAPLIPAPNGCGGVDHTLTGKLVGAGEEFSCRVENELRLTELECQSGGRVALTGRTLRSWSASGAATMRIRNGCRLWMTTTP